MISSKDKCIFVHIPKAAGQSVESIFVERMGLTWQQREQLLLKPNYDKLKGPPRLAHLFSSEYIDLDYISQAEYQSYFSFSFVRNPWARLVSEYRYRRLHGDKLYQLKFKSFLFKCFPNDLKDDYSVVKDYYRHIVPQWQFLYDDEGKQLVDFIGKFETLQQDFDEVCRKLNIEKTTLPHKNKTLAVGLKQRVKQKIKQLIPVTNTSRHYSEYYDDESMQFVSEYYKKDIELFGYKFEKL